MKNKEGSNSLGRIFALAAIYSYRENSDFLQLSIPIAYRALHFFFFKKPCVVSSYPY